MKKRHSNKQPKRLRLPIGAARTAIGIILIVMTGLGMASWNRERTFRAHSKALGFTPDWPRSIVERHIAITKNAGRAPKDPRYTSVHIVYRPDESETWRFNGNGTVINKRTNWLVTAHHLFEDRPGQYGYRVLGPRELKGLEPVIPISKCIDPESADDAITCETSPGGTNFPIIRVIGSGKRFTFLDDPNTQLRVALFPAKINFLTYPTNEVLKNEFFVEVKPGVTHMYFRPEVLNGESGTGALMEGQDENALMIIIRCHTFEHGRLPADVYKVLGSTKTETFGVGHLIRIN